MVPTETLFDGDLAMMHVGFVIIVGHGVDPHIISDLRDGAMCFFVQDEGTKKLYTPPMNQRNFVVVTVFD